MKCSQSFFKASNLFFLLWIFFLVSCNSEQLSGQQEALDKTVLMDKMAMDDDLITFLKATREVMQLATMGGFDRKEISKLLDKNGSVDYCDVDKASMSSVKGGADYVRIHCEMITGMRAFKAKYPQYDNLLTEAERLQVRYKCKMLNNMDTTGQEMSDIILQSRTKH